jgi:phosphosulfolactate synthase
LDFVDVVKIGWGLPALLPREELRSRISRYHKHHVLVSSGGTLTEFASLRRMVPSYFDDLAQANFDIVEISESRLNLSLPEKKRMLAEAQDRGLKAAIKVGRKSPRDQLGPAVLWEKLEEARALSPWRIIVESGEGRGVTLFDIAGELHVEVLDQLMNRADGRELILEAPEARQRTQLLLRLGPDVNLGAVSLQEVPYLETQRLGISAGETFGLHEKRRLAGGPAKKFVFFVVKNSAPIRQDAIVEATGLPRRTVQAALDLLLQEDLIIEEPDFVDLRRKLYRPKP